VPKVRRKPSSTSFVTEETRERMIDGAAEAFSELGYGVTRVEDILQAADVSRPTFYKAFESKDEIFEILSERHHREIRERVVRSVEGILEPNAQIEAMVDAFMRWRAHLGPLGRVLDQEARTPGTRLAKQRRETLDAIAGLGRQLMRRAGRGDVDPMMFHAIVVALEGLADALLQKRPVKETAVERAKRIALRLIGGSLGAPGDVIPPLPRPPGD
jgi:AcrR family transcriptional regulator